MKKDNILLLTGVFLLVLGTYITGAILTPYAKSLGASGIYIGLISSALYIVRLFIGTPIGKLADQKGILAVLKYSITLYPFTAIIYCFAINIPILLIGRFTHGIASAMMLPMAMAYIGQISPVGREGFYMGIYNTANLVASGIGPQTATIIASKYTSRSAFIAAFILSCIAFIITFVLRKSKILNEDNKNSIKVKNSSKTTVSSFALFKNKNLLALSSINIASAFISTLVSFFFILFAPTKGISIVGAGFLISVYNVVCGFVQIPIGKFSDSFNKKNLIIISGFFTALFLILFPFTNSIWLMLILMLILALVSAIFLSASSALSTILGRKIGMGSTMGFLGTSNSVGMVLGSLVLSILPDKFGLDALFYFSSASILICTISFGVLWNFKTSKKSYYLRK